MPDIGFDEELTGISCLSKDKKARVQSLAQNLRCIQDSLNIYCFFCWDYGPIPPAYLIKLYQAVSGIKLNSESLMHIGERVFNLCRMFHVLEGMKRQHDYLPGRVGESLPRGRAKGSTITREDLDMLLDQYYQRRGWSRDGIPTEETLKRLHLDQYPSGFPPLSSGE